tara:strand:+ start:28 stop:468 length:441 start_codon:yes stop_codon:yes gene_type:complete
MSNNDLLLKSILKSQKKANKILHSSQVFITHKMSRALRPFILNILRNFTNLEKDIQFCQFMQSIYITTTKKYIPILNVEIIDYDMYSKCHGGVFIVHTKYIRKLIKNLLNLRKKCEDSTIAYYNYLPGNKLPLEIRRKIISYISLV